MILKKGKHQSPSVKDEFIDYLDSGMYFNTLIYLLLISSG